VTYDIRAVSEADWQVLRSVRLQALADAPNAFATTLEEATAFSEDRWRERARGSETSRLFLAYVDERAVGIAGVYDEPGGSAQLISVWVLPEQRGRGVARALTTAVMHFAAAAGMRRMTVWFTDGNTRAQRLYERLGFRATERHQPMPSRASIEEHEMDILLEPPARASQGRGSADL
jgi:ribosomal protein S18 acetylase RimI-like enzyme